MIAKYDDPVKVWREHASEGVTVDGKALDCGHYVPEERPAELLAEVEDFLG